MLPPDATLSRFLTYSNHFKAGKATYKAFMPPPDLQLSMFQTDGIAAAEIRALAELNVLSGMSPGRSIYGHADLSVAVLIAQNLQPIRDDDPDRHTSVGGWPEGGADDKEAHKEIALELADAASLHLFDAPLSC